MHRISLITLLVHDYDDAIAFFTDKLGWTLKQDEPALTERGTPKRWVVVGPVDGPDLLLARADHAQQADRVGTQTGNRVALFLEADDFDADHSRLVAAGVEFVRPPRTEAYGKIAVFRDVSGNLWDLIERS